MNEAAGNEMEDLRKALQLAVCKIIFDEDREQSTRTTQSAIAALTEITFQYATQSLIPDLYTFSSHANRKSTISPEDVAVALRKLQPDQLEAFKRTFCRSGSKPVSSKNNTAVSFDRIEGNRKRNTTTAGRRRKRDETEVPLSSSSSSSDDCKYGDDVMTYHKHKPAPSMLSTKFDGGKHVGKVVSRMSASTRRSNENALSLPKRINVSGRKSTQRESLLNKFQLQFGPNSCTHNKNELGYDTSSTDDDDITRSPTRSLGMMKTARSKVVIKATTAGRSTMPEKKSLRGTQTRKIAKHQQNENQLKSKTHSNNDTLIDCDDDSTDDDSIFLNRNANKMKKKSSSKDGQLSVNPSGEKYTNSKSNLNKIHDLDDDKHFKIWDGQQGDTQSHDDGDGDDIDRRAPKQSQVAEALANLSSDSGMDYDDSEDGHEIHNAGEDASKRRHLPLIESDNDDLKIV